MRAVALAVILTALRSAHFCPTWTWSWSWSWTNTAATVLALLVFALHGGEARANPLRWFGLGAESGGMAGQEVSLGSGAGDLLSNPALLPFEADGAWVGLLVTGDKLSIDLDPRPGDGSHDVSPSIYQSSVAAAPAAGPLDRPLATQDLVNPRSGTHDVENLALLHVVLCSSLGLPGFKLAAGLVSPVEPIQSLHAWYSDEREQFFSNKVHFSRFGELPAMQLIMLSLSQRVSVLSFGLTLLVNPTAVTDTHVYVPEGSVQSYSYIDADIKATSRLGFVAAAAAAPWPGLRITLVLRQPSCLEAKGEGRVQLWNFDDYPEGGREIVQPYRFIVGWMPLELAAGVSYGREGAWGAGVTVTWQRWSQYRDLHGETPDPAFHDTVALLAAGRVAYWKGQTLLAGFGFHPTPVPAQTGRTNHADSHLLLFSLGHLSRFTLWGRRLEVSLFFQAWKLVGRAVRKDEGKLRDEYPDGSTDLRTGMPIAEAQGLQTNNPGFPGWRVDGWYFAGGLTVGYLW